MSFDWVCVYDAAACLYAMFEDRNLLDTQVEFGCPADGSGARLAFAKLPCIPPQGAWDSPPLVLGAYPDGDWHAAGDRFSSWWHDWAATPPLPAWCRQMGGITVGLNSLDDTAPEQNRRQLDSCTATSGIGWFHGAWWIAGITECWYPVQYQLSPDRIRRLRETTDEIRRGGGRTSVYTNALMLSRASPEYELWGKDLATVGANGGIWFTEHDAHYHPMALPYPNEAWAARYTEALEKAVLLGQPDMLYLDQLGAVPAHLDFAPEKHGHTHYGEWTAGQTRFVRAVRERFCTRRADLALCIETPSAPVQQYANFALLGITPVYRYVFPNYHGMVGEYGEVAPATALANAESAFLVGEPLLLLGADLPKADAATRDAIRAIVRLKRQVDSLLGGARYRDTRGLALPPDVRASVFVADRRLLLPFVNRALAADRVIGCDPVALGVQVQGQVRLHAPGDAALPTVVLPRGPGAQLRLAVPPVAAGVIEVW